MKPLVSVVVAVKNGERFLRQALDSIFAQTYTPFEVIAIDGHSTDQTSSILRSYPVIRSYLQQSLGVSAAYNEGIEATRGEFVSFLSHDDLWQKDKLEKQVAHLSQRHEVDYVICRAKFFLDNPRYIPPRFKHSLLEKDHVAPIMETLLARRSLFDRLGLFNTAYQGSDLDWYCRAHDTGVKGEVIQEPLLHKRIHDQNISLCFQTNEEILEILRHSIHRKREKFLEPIAKLLS